MGDSIQASHLTAVRKGNPQLYEHLVGPGPKRILALDGGGVLGVIEIAFLEAIETLLRKQSGNPRLVLADYFDLIGGTSTGSIIATALALGMTTAQVRRLYFDWAPQIFARPLWAIPVIVPQFNAQVLADKLLEVLGERELRSEDLKTGLAIITKRVDTGSAWVVTNNPQTRYWADGPLSPITGKAEWIGNKRYKLRHLIRASTAAPYYFRPKRLRIANPEPEGLFVDGGVSPHNNPALQLLMVAGIRGYGFNWKISKDDLLMISIGCGWARPVISLKRGLRQASALFAKDALKSIIWDASVNTLTVMQWLSTPLRPWPIDSLIGDLQDDSLTTQAGVPALLRFQRYDIAFDKAWLENEAETALSDAEVSKCHNPFDPDSMKQAYRLARAVAQKHVCTSHFDFDPMTQKARM